MESLLSGIRTETKKWNKNFDAENLLSNKFWDKDGNSVDSFDDANK